MSKIIGISASPRVNKYSEFFLSQCLSAVKEKAPHLEIDSFSLAGKNFSGCVDCDYCRSHFDCAQKDDLSPLLEKLKDPQIAAIILASPVYMGGMSSQAKAFLDRTVLFRRQSFYFKDKIAGAIAVGGSRNGGQDLTLMNIHAAFMIHDMLVVSDQAPTAHFGGAGWARVPDGPENDDLALETVKNLGFKIADLITRLHL